MKTYDRSPTPTNPYPDRWKTLTNFRFGSALSLIRPLNSVQERLGEDGNYILQHDLLTEVEVDGERRAIQVPRGLITDLTSVPPLGRIFVSRVGPWLEAALLHDYLYIAWQDIPERGAREADRRFADELFLVAMEHSEVAKWRRTLIFWSVRLFGGAPYRRRKTERFADLDDTALNGRLAFVMPSGRDQSTRTA